MEKYVYSLWGIIIIIDHIDSFIDESPRWLLTNNEPEKAKKILNKIATKNGKILQEKHDITVQVGSKCVWIWSTKCIANVVVFAKQRSGVVYWLEPVPPSTRIRASRLWQSVCLLANYLSGVKLDVTLTLSLCLG